MTTSHGHNEYSRVVRPLEFTLPAPDTVALTRSTKRSIDALFHSGTIDFTEVTESVGPVELYANPTLAPNSVFRSLDLLAYDRAMVTMTREFIDGESSLSHASLLLYYHKAPLFLGSELHILTNEETADTAIDIDNPQFYLEVPDAEQSGKDIIPLDYRSLMGILNGLVGQSNVMAAFENPDMSIEESLVAILEMADKTSVKRDTTYKFADSAMQNIGHAIVGITKHVHLSTENPTNPQLIQQAVTVENVHTLEDDDSTLSSTYVFAENHQRTSARIGVAYSRHFSDEPSDDTVERFEDMTGMDTTMWHDHLVASELDSHDLQTKRAQFGSYILAGLSTMANSTGERIFTPGQL